MFELTNRAGFEEKVWRYLTRKLGIPKIYHALDRQKLIAAEIRLQQLQPLPPQPLAAAELGVFSQGGEDGILQKLIQNLPGIPQTFIEFGVEDYTEANTRFLLTSRSWRGLIMDGSAKNIASIRRDEIYWKFPLLANQCFLTAENVSDAVGELGDAELGIISIDIDGNEYWVWNAIKLNPWIVVCEYNSHWGSKRSVTISYRADFDRFKAHYSGIYFGASLNALIDLGIRKGYVFVGCNSMGSNAFFIRSDVALAFKPLTAEQGFVDSPCRQARNESGKLLYLSRQQERKLIDHLDLFDLREEKPVKIGDLM